MSCHCLAGHREGPCDCFEDKIAQCSQGNTHAHTIRLVLQLTLGLMPLIYFLICSASTVAAALIWDPQRPCFRTEESAHAAVQGLLRAAAPGASQHAECAWSCTRQALCETGEA